MKVNLLKIVQGILSDMTSDPVNSISDTVEAMQVANIVERTFYNLVNDRLWPSTKRLFALTPSAEAARPTHMRLEDNVVEVDWVRYYVDNDVAGPHYKEILYKTPEEFLVWTMNRNALDANVQAVIDYSGSPLFVLNDQAPSYYTSFDDKHLVFDSYDNSVDSTLQGSKSQAYGIVEPVFVMEDTYIPDMPAKFFPYLISEATSTSFLKVKEQFSQKDEQNALRQKGHLSRNKQRLVDGRSRWHTRPSFGRNSPQSSSRYARSNAGYRDNHFTG